MNQLIVAGLGIKDLVQMTLESQQHLLGADKVLYLGVQPRQHIPQLKAWGIKNIESIIELYVDGDFDQTNYDRLYQATLESVDNHAKTVLLVPGHPRVGVSLVQQLVKNQDLFNLQILPGISSFDTMINDLERDPLEKGSVVMDTNRMLLFDLTWSATMDCYLYHVCSVGTRRVHLTDARKENAWDELKTHLLQIYSPDTIVHLISSTTSSQNQNQKKSATLSELETLLDYVHFGTTLFIPGAKIKTFNRAFYKRLQVGAQA